MEAFQLRVVNEQKELETRLIALSEFMGTEIYTKLPEVEQTLLKRQHDAMDTYNAILVERIFHFRGN